MSKKNTKTSESTKKLARNMAEMAASKGIIDPAQYTMDELTLLFEFFEQIRGNIEAK